MKTQCRFLPGIMLAFAILPASFAGTTIDGTNRYAYGANIGWQDWAAAGTNGAVIGNYVCSGYIYSANIGWINLGSGAPVNSIRYQNNSAADFGVNQDGLGHLSGYAYGANIGWISFETNGAPKVDLRTGNFTGYAWSANCGWISLSNAVAHVQTDSLYPGPLAPNGLPIPWLLSYFGTTNVNPNADLDGTGMTVGQDYIAGIDPTDPDIKFRITGKSFGPEGTIASLAWTSEPTRFYYIEMNTNLATTNWVDCGLGLISPSPYSATSATFDDTAAPDRFYRVRAVLPLSQ